jgi:O-acetyl-ADP-ribose deacetylase (regulator of RNase III)
VSKISLLKGDITKLEVDAIVNAANSTLMGGGGVDGAIHRAAGPKLDAECKQIISKIGFLETGNAVATSGGNLKCRYVIHTVGPVWHRGESNEAEFLEKAYFNSLALAKELDLKSIAFPNISTGVYGFPKKLAASVATETVYKFLLHNPEIQTVIFVCFDEENYQLYQEILSDDKFQNI